MKVKGHLGFIEKDLEKKKGRFYLSHERYGFVPVHSLTTGSFQCDRLFQPPLPRGAQRANVLKQNVQGTVSLTSWVPVFGIPRYFYVEEPIVCVACGAHDVFSTVEQKVWYETYHLPTYVDANRCAPCRAKERASKKLMAAVAKTKSNPLDSTALIEEAKARLLSVRESGRGDLNKAMACLHRALKLNPKQRDSIFWMAVLYERRGQIKKAISHYQTFLEAAPGSLGKLRGEAFAHLQRLQSGSK